MDAPSRRRLIEELCAFTGRGPGTDAERRAAAFLAGKLEASGRQAATESIHVHPQFALVHAVHAAIAIAGSLVATAEPAIGFALVLIAATSTYLDLQGRFYLIRRLFFRRASQNVIAKGSIPGAPLRVILTAHYDAGRSGFVYSTLLPRLNRMGPRARLLLSPSRVFFWLGIAPLLPILGAQMAGVDAGWLQILQLLPTMLLIVSAFLLVDIALSDIAPGANDNASGVAAVLSAAEELDASPPKHLDVWVLFTGGGASIGQGMRSFLISHGKELHENRVAIINVDSVAGGAPGYALSSGAVASIPFDGGLVSIAASLAIADREGENRYGAQPLRSATADDGLLARLRRVPALTISGGRDGAANHTDEDLPAAVDDPSLTAATEFLVGVVRLLDRDTGRGSPTG